MLLIDIIPLAFSFLYLQWNQFIMTSKRSNKHVILSDRHTKHFVDNKESPVFVSRYICMYLNGEKQNGDK